MYWEQYEKKTINNAYQLQDEFRKLERKDEFTIEALGVILEHLQVLEEILGEEFECDPVGICCDFSEYGSAVEANNDLEIIDPDLLEPDDEQDDCEDELRRKLDRCGVTLESSNGNIIIDNSVL